jgi:hypothetical protein
VGGELQALWCQKAIEEAAPFGPFPEDLRRQLDGQPRTIRFTFYY